MSDASTIDSSALPPLPQPAAELPPHGDAHGSASAKPAPAKKARRPRPTFDDGSLTRTFKFPSKAYPRSSYYVTSTEIIIRIKKARKKWKLTVPKKRLVSYRTNRWFAKPRWVAIELTYTQAVKLGLADARPRAPEATVDIGASNTSLPTEPDVALTHQAQAAPLALTGDAPGEADAAALQADLADQISDLGDQDGAEDFQLAAANDEPDPPDFDAHEIHPDAPPAEPEPPVSQHEPLPNHATAAVKAEDAGAQVVHFVPQQVQSAAAPSRPSRHLLATLAAALTGFAIWAAFDAAPLNPTSDCERSASAAHCTSAIVTGSIDAGSGPAPPASAPIEEPPLSTAEIDATARAEVAAQDLAAPVPEPVSEPASVTVREPVSLPAPVPVVDEKPAAVAPTGANPGTADAVVVVDRDVTPPAPVVTAAVATPGPTEAAGAAVVACESLGNIGRELQIHFDPASALIDPAAIAALDDFAAKLRACPASKVTIEGHTDSDGTARWNRTLSLLRAQAVHKRLVASGADPARLAAVGFGQTRPSVPNVSLKNKRNNRRVVLVVATQR